MQFYHLLMSILTLSLLWIHRCKRIHHTGLKIEVFPIVIRPTLGNNLLYTFDSAPPVDKDRTAVRAFHEFSSKNDTLNLRKSILLAIVLIYTNLLEYLCGSRSSLFRLLCSVPGPLLIVGVDLGPVTRLHPLC